MKTGKIVAAVLICIAVGGCSKKGEEGNSKAPPARAEKAKVSGPFGDFDMERIKHKWNGAWVVGGSTLGTKEAWEVQGDKVRVYDGKSEKSLDFELRAPCVAYVSETRNGTTTGTYSKFAFDGDTLYKGLGNAGLKKGDHIVACVSADVYTFKNGKCTRWKEDMFDRSKLNPKDAQCSLEGDVFKVKVSKNYQTELKVKGNVLLNQQMQGNQALKAQNFAEAKAKLEK